MKKTKTQFSYERLCTETRFEKEVQDRLGNGRPIEGLLATSRRPCMLEVQNNKMFLLGEVDSVFRQTVLIVLYLQQGRRENPLSL